MGKHRHDSSLSCIQITDDTKKMLKKINDDVVIYVMAAKDGSDDTIKKTLKNYENSFKCI